MFFSIDEQNEKENYKRFENLTNRGLDLDDVVGIGIQTSPTRGFIDRVVSDADDIRLTQISFQQNAYYSIYN